MPDESVFITIEINQFSPESHYDVNENTHILLENHKECHQEINIWDSTLRDKGDKKCNFSPSYCGITRLKLQFTIFGIGIDTPPSETI